jgi:hypothetical protein
VKLVVVLALFAGGGFVVPTDPVATALFSLFFIAGLLFVFAGVVGTLQLVPNRSGGMLSQARESSSSD